MAFANFSVLAAGALMVGIPVLLHLVMRQRPRYQVFPALRFLNRRIIANKRQMRLRNWLLLALRMAAIALIALVMSRPSVDSLGLADWSKFLLLAALTPLALVALAYSLIHRKGQAVVGSLAVVSLMLCAALSYFGYRAMSVTVSDQLGDAQAPVAAVLVFDTSPRMGIRHENQTRLDQARALARQLITQLPMDSEVAVVDATGSGAFSADMGAAVNILDSLQVMGMEFPLSELLLQSIHLVAERDDKRQEVYVFSDLSMKAWQQSSYTAARNQLAEHGNISVFVLDVGTPEPRNLRLGELRISSNSNSSDSLVRGQPLQIDTEVFSQNMDGGFEVELLLERPDPTRPVIVDGKPLLPTLTTRDRQRVTLSPGAEVPVSLALRNLSEGVHHGRVTLKSHDGLTVDDTRYFTIQVGPPHPILLLTSPGAVADYVKQSISPEEIELRGESAFACRIHDAADLVNVTIEDDQVVAMLDPAPLPQPHWDKLYDYVRAGGSLAIFLGRNAQPGIRSVADFNQLAAKVLPGPLRAYWRTPPDNVLFFSPSGTAHPILRLFRGRESIAAWDEAPIYTHWTFGDLKPGTNVVALFSNSQPAVLESVVGEGKIVVLSTPVSDRLNDPDRPAWNHVPTSLPFFMLMNGLFSYLADHDAQSWNHEVGQVVIFDQHEGQLALQPSWQLVTPQGDWQNVRREGDQITITSTDVAGTYRLMSNSPGDPPLGFSVNLPSRATDLTRIEKNKLAPVLGDRVTVARDITALNRDVGRARVGRELFPFLMLIVIGVLAVEHLLSNRFYANQAANPADRNWQAAA